MYYYTFVAAEGRTLGPKRDEGHHLHFFLLIITFKVMSIIYFLIGVDPYEKLLVLRRVYMCFK